MKWPSALCFAGVAFLAVLAGCSAPATRTMPAAQISSYVKALSPEYAGRRDLYVADYGFGKIIILRNDRYQPDGTITNGINGPQGLTLDSAGNLYVANRAGGDVAEYAPGASKPSFVYSGGIVSPLSVNVDRQNHVFVIDVPALHGPDAVVEYRHGTNVPLYRCIVNGVFSVTSDSRGNVFVDYNKSVNGGGHILEYIGGLKGCSPTLLQARVDYAAGMAIDNQNSLIVADGNAVRLDVIPPPYSGTKRTITGFGTPLFVSIDQDNKRLFVSASSFLNSYVYVVDYASGKILWQMGYAKRGISEPYGVVDGPNAVP